jgi:hypothetical protein
MNDTIGSILRHKSQEVWSVQPDSTVYDAIALMAMKSVERDSS